MLMCSTQLNVLKQTTATQKSKRTEFIASEIFLYLYFTSATQPLQTKILFLKPSRDSTSFTNVIYV